MQATGGDSEAWEVLHRNLIDSHTCVDDGSMRGRLNMTLSLSGRGLSK